MDSSREGGVADAAPRSEPDSGQGEGAREWGPRVGAVLDDDSSVWCVVQTSGVTAGELEAFLRRAPSDAEQAVEAPYRFESGRVKVSLPCSEQADGGGRRVLIETPASRDADDDRVSAACPADAPYAGEPSCELEGFRDADPEAAVVLRLIHLPARRDPDGVMHASGERCITGTSQAQVHTQVTGFTHEWLNSDGAIVTSVPLENEALMRSAQVGGTDEGSIFFARGKLWFVFGDTGALDANDPLQMAVQAPPLWRSNVLAYTEDFDAADGLLFGGFETVPGASMAKELVISPKETLMPRPDSEFTAIPLAGFGFTAADGHHYRFLWFVSVHQWSAMLVGPDFKANYSSLAYSVDGSPDWTRMPSPPSPPAPNFGPGAVWFDRLNRWLYFFGITPDRGAVRLARVRSTFEAVTDPERYEYWTGERWAAGDPAAAAVLIEESSSYAPRSEISVIYNQAADVWMMMTVNWFSSPPAADVSNQVELWQAHAVTGPWTKVDADAQLPNGRHALQCGPMMSEHLLGDGGREVPFLLSQFFPVYNVHRLSYRIEVGACP